MAHSNRIIEETLMKGLLTKKATGSRETRIGGAPWS